jgi:hypothetical protein
MDAPSVSQERVTDLLVRWSDGDDAALAELTPLVYEELRRLAHRQMGAERTDHTLQTTALVNEAYLRLADQINLRWQNRAHFFAVPAKCPASATAAELIIAGCALQLCLLARGRRQFFQSKDRVAADPKTAIASIGHK